MKLFIRAHDLGVSGLQNVLNEVSRCNLDGVQMVAYKCLPDVTYAPQSMTVEKAQQIAAGFSQCGKNIALIGAYFNPVHSNKEKTQNAVAVFKNYIDIANVMGCNTIGSETGSYNDDKWTYHPQNITDIALQQVVQCFTQLADYAALRNAYVALEGAAAHVCFSVDRLKEAVDKINRPNIKVIFDLFNFLTPQNFANRNQILLDGLKTFGKKIVVFHLKDCIAETGGELKQVAVGRGVLDFDYILWQILHFNADAKLVLEGTTGDEIATSIEFIRNTLTKLGLNK